MNRSRRSCLAGLLVLLLGSSTPARAASLSPRETRLLGKILEFMEPRPTGDGVVAVVYAAGGDASHRDAAAIAAGLGAGIPTAGGLLKPVVVAGNALAGMSFALVIAAAGASSAAMTQVARERHVLCVTGDTGAVRAGACDMAINSRPRVGILLNHAAIAEAGLRFATAFRMMVHEI